jgi:hypothetical protein
MSSVSFIRTSAILAALAITAHYAFAGPGFPMPTPPGPTVAVKGPGFPMPTPPGPTVAVKGPGFPMPTPPGPTVA